MNNITEPWRVVATDNAVHFYLKRSKGFNYNENAG